MKLVKPLLLLTLFVIGFACSNDDDTSSSDSGIVGTWEVTEIDYSGTSATIVSGIETTATFTGTGINMDLVIIFSENPNNYTTAGDYDIQLMTTTGGQTFTSFVANENFISNGTWELNGDLLTVNQPDGSTVIATILSLTENEMVIAWSFMNEETQSGVTTIQDVDGTYTFTRQ